MKWTLIMKIKRKQRQNGFHNFQVILKVLDGWKHDDILHLADAEIKHENTTIFTVVEFWPKLQENWNNEQNREKKRCTTIHDAFGQCVLCKMGKRTEYPNKANENYWVFSISLIFILHIKNLFIRFHISWWIKFILQNCGAGCVMVRFLHNLPQLYNGIGYDDDDDGGVCAFARTRALNEFTHI